MDILFSFHLPTISELSYDKRNSDLHPSSVIFSKNLLSVYREKITPFRNNDLKNSERKKTKNFCSLVFLSPTGKWKCRVAKFWSRKIHKRHFPLFLFPSFLLEYAHCILNFLDVIDLFAHRRVLVLQSRKFSPFSQES